MPPVLKTEKTPLTYEQFLRMKDEDTHAEWVNGEVIVLTPPKSYHQRVLRFLAYLLEEYLQRNPVGEFLFAPFELYLPRSNASREPDLFVVRNENLQHLDADRFTGAPDVVVEVISDDSLHRDSVEKFLEYEREGVREYWLIDPRPGRRAVHLFRLQDGSYVPVQPDESSSLNSSVLPGFRLKAEWFTGEGLPGARAAAQEMLAQD
jgi:Uma2 family endonuclease